MTGIQSQPTSRPDVSSPGSPRLPMRELLFQKAWWLDTVAPHAWDEVQVQGGGEVIARWPFQRRQRHGLVTLTQPMLCARLGPWLSYTETRPDRRMAEHKEQLYALVDQLPRFDLLRQNCSPEFSNWLPLFWRGFAQTTRYTYRFERLDDLAAARAGMNGNMRSNVKHAARRLQVQESDDAELLWRVCQQTYQRRGLPFPYSPQLLERACRACRERDAGTILIAVDEAGQVHAADFYVWDDHTLHTMLRGRADGSTVRGAPALVLWHAIGEAARRGLAFDCHGSMVPGIEEFYRSTGAQLTPYSHISRASWRHQTLAHLRSAWQEGRQLLAAHLPGRRP